jgi:putative secretion ATPase (PEP-CTERM system associated)
MYERFYNLRERPFALSPDPEYLYLSRVHREALDSIRYGIESRAGFIVITGDIGAGKTTLLQSILGRLDDRTVVARLVNTTLEPRELLESILIEFGVDTAGKSKPLLLRDLGEFLVRQRTQGRRPLLVVDEAQNLSSAGLEEIRLLSNLETEKSKLLQILLAGQPNLRDKIASPELEQFRQRVAVSYHLTPLDAQETAAYIQSRLEHAAIGPPPRFPTDAAELVHRRSGGVPRIINVICDAALVFGYAEERHQIDLALLQDVVAELELTGVLRAPAIAEAPATPRVEAPQAAPVPAREPMPAAVMETAPVSVREAPASVAPMAARLAEPAAAVRIDARDTVLARAAAQEAAVRASALAGREQAITQRERELAEQRRVLAEEYRLLRHRQAPRPAAAAAAPVTAARPPRRPAPPPAMRFRSTRPDGFFAWLRRLISSGSNRLIAGTRSFHGS